MPSRLTRPESAEGRFLRGPQSRETELRRAIGIFVEFLRGFRKYHFVGPCVTVFGSARSFRRSITGMTNGDRGMDRGYCASGPSGP